MTSTTTSAAVLSAPSPLTDPPRSLTTTLAPWSASMIASPRPTPLPEPVTIATLPSSMPICAFPLPTRKLTCASPYRGRDCRCQGAQDRMAVDTSVIGRPTGAWRVQMERSVLANFAKAVGDASDAYRGDVVPAPPTFTFAAPYWSALTTPDQPADPTKGQGNPMHTIMGDLYG